MANAWYGNKVLIDSTGSLTTDRLKVVYMLFTPSSSNDSVTLRESSSGPDVFFLQGATAKTTMYFRFDEAPVVFNGLYVQSISSGAKLQVITTTAGS